MLLQVILEGIGLGVLLILVCAIGIRKATVIISFGKLLISLS